MAVIHKGVDKIIDSSANEVVIATVKATIDNQVNKADVGHGHNINDLTDVTVTGASPGQVLSYTSDLNSTGVPGWEPATVSSGGSGATSMGQLSDVDLTTTAPQNLDVLQYNGSQWEPATISGGGGTSNVANLDDLTDVDTTTTAPTDQQVLAWDASNSVWSPTSFSAASGSGSADLGISVTTAGSDVDYTFNATTPSGVPGMDTSSLAVGSTMMWNGSSWVDSGLVIETYT